MKRSKAFTLIELMVVISIIALLISILVPALGRIKDTANRMKSSTQIRGIHQSLVAFAQGNGAQEWFAGLDSSGQELTEAAAGDEDLPYYDGVANPARNVEARLALMLGNDYYTTDFLISPSEKATGIGEYGDPDDKTLTDFDDGNYSYSLLQIDDPAAANPEDRLTEWRNTINSQAPIASDRVIERTGQVFATGTTTTYASLHSDANWKGNVAYNDGHVEFEGNVELNTTKYGDNITDDDDLFEDASGASAAGEDALMIANGNGKVAANIENSND